MDDTTENKSKIEALSTAVADEFASTNRILSFEDWFEMMCSEPKIHLRNAAQYICDAFDHFGKRDVRTPGGKVSRFCLFDRKFDDGHRLVGQEAAQNALFEALDGFRRLGKIDYLLLLHGPNGSAKSTILECLQAGIENYSHSEKGCLYRFSWVFPTKEAGGAKIGFVESKIRAELGADSSFANYGVDQLDARIVDESRDHPIFLIPLAQRKRLLADLFRDDEMFVVSDTIANGDLSARNRRIFDALLNGYHGDLRKVYQHIQVERFFLSRNYRSAVVDVEPKQTVDARSFPVTGDRAFSHLPPSVGGQVLYGLQGDLVDANRGLINFSDLFKRPYEHYKYLLTATETGRIVVDQIELRLDQVFTGSANDINLLEFRATRASEYQSFRARIILVPVPYLLDYRVERKIYQEQVGDLLRGVHIAPHVPRILALWGVMTRMRRPDPDIYNPKIAKYLRRTTPLEKADLYAYGRVPAGLSSEEARELLAAVPKMHQERFEHAVVRAEGMDHPLGDYEGSFGASVRDLKGILLSAASEPGTTCVTVSLLFSELRRYMNDAVHHHWMMLDHAGSGFHLLDDDSDKSITALAWNRWLDLSDWEVREALGLVDEKRYLDLFRRYVIHAKHYVKRERIYDEVTGQLRDPDNKFMTELEKAMDPNAGETFRQELLARIGAWALTHPNEEPAYHEIFADYFSNLREDYYRQQKETVRHGIQYMLELLREEEGKPVDHDMSAQEKEKAVRAVDFLLGKRDTDGESRECHTKESLIDTLVQLSRHRY